MEEYNVYRRFFELTGAKEQYVQLMKMTADQVGQATGNVKSNNEVVNALEEAIPFEDLYQSVYLPVLKETFPDEMEVRYMNTFFETPTGQRYVHSIPQIMQRSGELVNTMYASAIQEKIEQLFSINRVEISEVMEGVQRIRSYFDVDDPEFDDLQMESEINQYLEIKGWTRSEYEWEMFKTIHIA